MSSREGPPAAPPASAARHARDPLAEWERLPRRLYLDSSTLQTVMRYGEFIWENVPPPEGDRAYKIPGFTDDLEALRFIFQVNERAMFDIVVTRSAIEEVAASADGAYLQWATDVAAHWRERIREYEGRAFRRPDGSLRVYDRRLGYISAKDRRLLRDAIATECHAFITMERKLARHAAHFEAFTGLKLLRPPEYALLLAPWARLYR